MDDFVRTIPLPAATESTEVPSDVESDEDERLDLGFKWESSDASSESEAASNDSASEVSGADSDNEDAAAASEDTDGSEGSSDENDDEEDDEDDSDDGSDAEKAVSADAPVAADADSSAGEEEESKIPRYKPGTHEKVPEFAELHLSRPLLRAVNEMKYKVPTTIQVSAAHAPSLCAYQQHVPASLLQHYVIFQLNFHQLWCYLWYTLLFSKANSRSVFCTAVILFLYHR